MGDSLPNLGESSASANISNPINTIPPPNSNNSNNNASYIPVNGNSAPIPNNGPDARVRYLRACDRCR